MNKEQLIAKCKEIESGFKLIVCESFIEIQFREYFIATIWEHCEHISIDCYDETEFLPINFPQILTLAQQYFKGQENE